MPEEIGEKVVKTTAVMTSSVYGILVSTPWAIVDTLGKTAKGVYKGSIYGSTGFLLGPAGLITVPVGMIVGGGIGLLYGAGKNLSDITYTAYLGGKTAYYSDADTLKSGILAANNYALHGIYPESENISFVLSKTPREKDDTQMIPQQIQSSIEVPIEPLKKEAQILFLQPIEEMPIRRVKSFGDLPDLSEWSKNLGDVKKSEEKKRSMDEPDEDPFELVMLSDSKKLKLNQRSEVMPKLSIDSCAKIINDYRISNPVEFKAFFEQAVDESFVSSEGLGTGYYNPLSNLSIRSKGVESIKLLLAKDKTNDAFSALGLQGSWNVAGYVVGTDSFNTKVIDGLYGKIIAKQENKPLLEEYKKSPYFVKNEAKNIFSEVNRKIRQEKASSPDLPIYSGIFDRDKNKQEQTNGF
ncbi:MAG: hypothetical protein EP298_00520 [Gammaproteobacteria bacterium]|nr:MAG: hypothetical protein EP298_00520 [Gammaproteobacteria bacterium]UTW41897.1 hypothetical protein KFE69_10335 [bacterium SCSIO 12844]